MMVSVLTILGTLSLLGGGIGYFAFPYGVSFGVNLFINLSQNGMVFPLYMNPPFSMQSKFLLFEITNPRQVLRGAKMQFKAKGPYHYKTFIRRDEISFLDDNQRVKFNSHRKLYANEEASGDFDERMWLINPIIPSTLKTVKAMILDRVPFSRLSEPIVIRAVNVLLDSYGERLILRTTPRTLLDGRKVQLLQMLTDLATRFGLSSLVPPGPPQNVFGLAFVQNETIDRMEIYTGLGETKKKFAEVIRWKGKERADVWQGDCGAIRGTNGELYKPFVNVSRPLSIFFSPLCRSFTLVPNTLGQPYKTSAGFEAWEFDLNPRLYAGARNNPRNRCYCEDSRTFDCQYDGLISMGRCFFESPLFFARPNFNGADPRIRQTTDFESSPLPPMPEKQTIALDQTTGTVLAVNLSLMAVFKVVRHPYMRDLARVQNITYAPAFITTESMELPFKYGWQIWALQQMNVYYQPAMLATAALGAGTLALKLFI